MTYKSGNSEAQKKLKKVLAHPIFVDSFIPAHPTHATHTLYPTMNAIENLINGNLTDAKRLAKKHSYWKLMTLAEHLGYPIHQCVAISGYLKGNLSFQVYCDTMQK